MTRILEKYIDIFPPILFFCSDDEHSMHFILSLKYLSDAQQEELVELMHHCGAEVSFSVEDVTNYSAVIVDHDEVVNVKTPAFTLKYIEDCLTKLKVQDISNYRQDATSHIASNVQCMDVVYFRKRSWDSVLTKAEKQWSFLDEFQPESSDEEDLQPKEKEKEEKKTSFDFDAADEDLFKSTKDKKHSRLPYSYDEQSKILKYIIDHCEYSRIKGRELWMIMERRKICPNRTWQSMKEHFLKKIAFHLEAFDFLSASDKMKLKQVLF